MSVLFVGCKSYYLRGTYDRQNFIDQCRWKHPVASKYRPDPLYLDSLRRVEPFDAYVFVGTWCSDSRKWVPRFLAIADQLPLKRLEFIAIDTTKRDSAGLTRVYSIDSVPTFIFLRQNQEIGRLVTKPHKRRLERSLYQILK